MPDEVDGVLREVQRQLSGNLALSERWSQEGWWNAYCYLFLAAPALRHALLAHQDDMLWLVTATAALGSGTPPVTLRRNTSHELPHELRPGGRDYPAIDWAASLLLNLVVQATYVLTVVQCRHDALPAVAQGHAVPGHGPTGPAAADAQHAAQQQQQQQQQHGPVVAAQRRVYGSPMKSEVNLDNTRSRRTPAPCYPDVCFSVDSFEEAFADIVISRPDDCYAVLLHVHAPAAASDSTSSSGAPPPASSQGAHALPANTPPSSTSGQPAAASHPQAHANAGAHERRAALFSAYVTRDQVAEFLAGRAAGAYKPPSLLNRLLGAGKSGPHGGGAGHKERVVMTGPGGVGRAEVVATAGAAAHGGGAGAAAGAATPGRAAAAVLQLSLMWMSLPVHALASAVLRFACEGA